MFTENDFVTARDAALDCIWSSHGIQCNLPLAWQNLARDCPNLSLPLFGGDLRGADLRMDDEDIGHLEHFELIVRKAFETCDIAMEAWQLAVTPPIVTAIEVAAARRHRTSRPNVGDMEATTWHFLAGRIAGCVLFQPVHVISHVLPTVRLPTSSQHSFLFDSRLYATSPSVRLELWAGLVGRIAADRRWNPERLENGVREECAAAIADGVARETSRTIDESRPDPRSNKGRALRALFMLQALSSESRVNAQRIAIHVTNVATCSDSQFKKVCGDLVQAGLAQSCGGPGGGYWLTQQGRQMAESMPD